MKVPLALLLAFLGIPLVLGGAFFTYIMMALSNADISSEGGEGTIVAIGMSSIGVGLALWYAAWRLWRSDKK